MSTPARRKLEASSLPWIFQILAWLTTPIRRPGQSFLT
jgi:hypothetical protein